MIPIRNIYYMLSYAFQALSLQGVREADIESFDNAQKLLAEILIKGVGVQIKRGLGRDYLPSVDSLSTVRGKIDINDSIKDQSILRRRLICIYDDFSVNTDLNQVIKSVFVRLLRMDITAPQKKEIKRLLVFFQDVEVIDLHSVDWKFHYSRNNQSYQLIINICKLLVDGMLQTESAGSIKTADFIDEQRMSRLYEKFILEYYRKHYPELSPAAAQIGWQLDDEFDDMLPNMRSDIMLREGNCVLIIDAKFYSHSTQNYYGQDTVHSGNLYQIFTYVKNKEYELKDEPHRVSGLLLYAKTDEEIQPSGREYRMSGNSISVDTLDLNQEFSEIARQLNGIVERCFQEAGC